MGRLFPPPQFGVPLSTEQMENELPFNAIYGITPSNKYIPISIDSTGRLNTNATLTGTITIAEIGAPDESPFFFGASLSQPVSGAYDDTAPNLAVGQQGVVRLTQARAFHINLRDSSGVEIFPATEATLLSIDSNVALIEPNVASIETHSASIDAGIQTLNSLVPSKYDYIDLQYSANNLTQAVFKLGGPTGTVVSTLMLTYAGTNLTSVQRV